VQRGSLAKLFSVVDRAADFVREGRNREASLGGWAGDFWERSGARGGGGGKPVWKSLGFDRLGEGTLTRRKRDCQRKETGGSEGALLSNSLRMKRLGEGRMALLEEFMRERTNFSGLHHRESKCVWKLLGGKAFIVASIPHKRGGREIAGGCKE